MPNMSSFCKGLVALNLHIFVLAKEGFRLIQHPLTIPHAGACFLSLSEL